MVMQMSGSNGILSVPDEHLPGLVVLVLIGPLVGALVHAAIVPTHWGDERVTAILFIVDTAGFALAFWWTFMARTAWRLVVAAMLGGTACVYALYILKGWETMDPV